MGTFMITVQLWKFAGMENQELPVLRSLLFMLLQFFFEKGVSSWVQKDHGEMIFIGGQWCAGGNSPLKNVVFSRLAVVHKCQANSSLLGWLSNFKWCVKFALEATKYTYYYLTADAISNWGLCAGYYIGESLLLDGKKCGITWQWLIYRNTGDLCQVKEAI